MTIGHPDKTIGHPDKKLSVTQTKNYRSPRQKTIGHPNKKTALKPFIKEQFHLGRYLFRVITSIFIIYKKFLMRMIFFCFFKKYKKKDL